MQQSRASSTRNSHHSGGGHFPDGLGVAIIARLPRTTSYPHCPRFIHRCYSCGGFGRTQEFHASKRAPCVCAFWGWTSETLETRNHFVTYLNIHGNPPFYIDGAGTVYVSIGLVSCLAIYLLPRKCHELPILHDGPSQLEIPVQSRGLVGPNNNDGGCSRREVRSGTPAESCFGELNLQHRSRVTMIRVARRENMAHPLLDTSTIHTNRRAELYFITASESIFVVDSARHVPSDFRCRGWFHTRQI